MDNRVNLGGSTPYLLAAQAADVAAMRRLAERGADPRLATYANNTAVMPAAGVGHVEGSRRFRPESEALAAVRLALDAGVDVNAGNANGQTALHGAVYRAADTIIRHLVDAGARMDFADELDLLLYGGCIGDGNLHTHTRLPAIVAGGAGGRLEGGRHLRYPDGTPMANLLLSILDTVDVHRERIGDSTGRLAGLL